MLPLHFPSLPPVPLQELNVSENNVSLVCPFIPKGIIMLTISAKAAIKKVKFLFMLFWLLLFLFIYYAFVLNPTKIRLFLIQKKRISKLMNDFFLLHHKTMFIR